MAGTKKPSQKAKAYINPKETLQNISQGPDVPREIDAQRRTSEHVSGQNEKKKVGANPEFTTLFTKHRYNEGTPRMEKMDDLRHTLAEVRKEVQILRVESAGLSAEIESIDRATLQALPERVGVYHVQYFELILEYIRNLRVKIVEARNWLNVARGKKAKRGVAGVQQSQSQELQLARSVG